jgi:hypothetical protein
MIRSLLCRLAWHAWLHTGLGPWDECKHCGLRREFRAAKNAKD